MPQLVSQPREPGESTAAASASPQRRRFRPPIVALALIAIGAALRIAHHATGRSLWLDEALFALTLLPRSLSELVSDGLNFGQIAPIGFVVVEKLMVEAFGPSDAVLRMFPLMCGLVSLPLFYLVARRYLPGRAWVIALALFALSNSAIYYSSEVKQYGVDVFVVLVLLLMAITLRDRPITPARILFFAAVFATAPLLSHPATFVVAGLSMVLFLTALLDGNRRRAAAVAVVGGAGMISFAVIYLVKMRPIATNVGLLGFWERGFVPWPLYGSDAFLWLIRRFFELFDYPIGSGAPPLGEIGPPLNMSLGALTGFAFIVGCISLLRSRRRNFALLISPVVVALAAAALHRYPLEGRLALFLVPFGLLLAGEGARWLRELTAATAPVIGIGLIGLILLQPTATAAYHLKHPRLGEEVRAVLRYVEKHSREDEALYVYNGAMPAYMHYAPHFTIAADTVLGVRRQRNWNAYFRDLDRLRRWPRAWVLFSHTIPQQGLDEQAVFLLHLNRIGRRLDQYRVRDASVILYEILPGQRVPRTTWPARPPDSPTTQPVD